MMWMELWQAGQEDGGVAGVVGGMGGGAGGAHWALMQTIMFSTGWAAFTVTHSL